MADGLEKKCISERERGRGWREGGREGVKKQRREGERQHIQKIKQMEQDGNNR